MAQLSNCAELVREADEHRFDRGHAAAQRIRRDDLFEREADDDADRVEDAGEEEAHELKYETVNLRGIVTEVVESLKLQLEKNRAVIHVVHDGNLELQGDRLHLLSVVFNLLDNAVKYSKENPVISVTMKGDDKTVQLTVTDNGIDIAPKYKEKIFDKFFRVPHGDTHNAKGYGLGLSYVAQVIKKHKGTIEVKSEEGQGTTFFITLPKSSI